jgi:hypothetical protein
MGSYCICAAVRAVNVASAIKYAFFRIISMLYLTKIHESEIIDVETDLLFGNLEK